MFQTADWSMKHAQFEINDLIIRLIPKSNKEIKMITYLSHNHMGIRKNNQTFQPHVHF